MEMNEIELCVRGHEREKGKRCRTCTNENQRKYNHEKKTRGRLKVSGVYLLHFDMEIDSENIWGDINHYVGWSNDIWYRIKEHKTGSSSFTKKAIQLGSKFEIGNIIVTDNKKTELRLAGLETPIAYCAICNNRNAFQIERLFDKRFIKGNYVSELPEPPDW